MGKPLVRKSIAAGLQTIRAVRPLMVRIRGRDEALAQQLVRALNDVVLSIARAEHPARGAVRAHVLAAVGSAIEARALLQMTVDFRYCTWRSVKRACEKLDRTTSMLRDLARLVG